MGLGETESLERATKTTTRPDEIMVRRVVAPEGERVGATPHATGEMVEYVTYTAYGQTESDYRNQRWQLFREQYRFTGNEDDAEVGLSYHGARYYSPALKRFMSADPVTVHSAGSDINPYSYGNGNPTSYVDPDGRFGILVVVGVAAISAAVAAGTNAAVQYATTGHVNNWGWSGVGGAALAGAVGGLVGAGVLGAIGGGIMGATVAGAAGGATSGALGTGFAGGDWNDVGKAALLGGVSGAVGGGVGVLAGSQSGGWSGFAGTMAGTGAGTGAGIGFGWAAFGQDPTWQSAGIAFASAFGGAIASSALSKGWSEATEGDVEGAAARGQASGEAAGRAYHGTRRAMYEAYTARLESALQASRTSGWLADNTALAAAAAAAAGAPTATDAAIIYGRVLATEIAVAVAEVSAGALLGAFALGVLLSCPGDMPIVSANDLPTTVDDLQKGATPAGISKPGMGSDKYMRPGGGDRANKEFDSITKGLPIKEHGDGIRSAKLPNGTTIGVRPHSSGADGGPTIQVNPPNGNPLKYRFR